MYLLEIGWFLTWPLLIFLSYYIISRAVQKMDNEEK